MLFILWDSLAVIFAVLSIVRVDFSYLWMAMAMSVAGSINMVAASLITRMRQKTENEEEVISSIHVELSAFLDRLTNFCLKERE